MQLKRWAHRYIDKESGQVLASWFPRSNEKLPRGCLAQKLGFIHSDFIEVTIKDLNQTPKSALLHDPLK